MLDELQVDDLKDKVG